MQTGCTVWLTGLSGAGKTTLANLLATRLRQRNVKAEILDGDVLRTSLCQGLGFSRADREENIRRIGFVCELLTRNDIIAIVAAISPYRAGRDHVRAKVSRFVEVYVRCPLDVLIHRDAKGLYRRALAGELLQFTGISDVYEPPLSPEVTVDSSSESPDESVEKILVRLVELSIV